MRSLRQIQQKFSTYSLQTVLYAIVNIEQEGKFITNQDDGTVSSLLFVTVHTNFLSLHAGPENSIATCSSNGQ